MRARENSTDQAQRPWRTVLSAAYAFARNQKMQLTQKKAIKRNVLFDAGGSRSGSIVSRKGIRPREKRRACRQQLGGKPFMGF
jgi:hypothetical protein